MKKNWKSENLTNKEIKWVIENLSTKENVVLHGIMGCLSSFRIAETNIPTPKK